MGRDLFASLVVFMVALPLDLGIAMASGVSPTVGILSGVIAGIVVGTLAGCPLQVSGPAAGLIAIVWQIINTHGLGMLGPIVLAAGLLQIALGASRLIPWFRAMAPSVIHGLLAGIGVLIVASQFLVMLNKAPGPSGILNLLAGPEALIDLVADGSGSSSALLGLLTIGTVVVCGWLPQRFKMIPGPLIGVVLAVLAAWIVKPQVAYVELPTDGLPEFHFLNLGQLSGLGSFPVLGSVLALAFIATAQTLLTAHAVDRLHEGARTDYNREIVAQGAGNSICGLLGLLPVSGVIVRSTSNLRAGAQTRLSTILHGVWVALFLLYLSPILRLVPLPALAAVLVYTGYRLVSVQAFREVRRLGSADLVIYAVTLVGVVGVDLLSGLVSGLLLSALHLGFKMTNCRMESRENEGVLTVKLKGSGTLLTLPQLKRKLAELPSGRVLRLSLKELDRIDYPWIEHLTRWQEGYLAQGGEVTIEWDQFVERLCPGLTDFLSLRAEPTYGEAFREREPFHRLIARDHGRRDDRRRLRRVGDY